MNYLEWLEAGQPEPPDGKFWCPRRAEGGMYAGPDEWQHREQMADGLVDEHCSYCGSLRPEKFLELVKAAWEVGPTDKNYKAYLSAPDSHKDTKFYFQHLNTEQRHEFIDLYNSKKMKVGYPGYFYRKPFFVALGTAADHQGDDS